MASDDDSESAKPNVTDKLLLDLIERGLGDRVYERLLTRFKTYLALLTAVGVIVGALLGWAGFQQLSLLRIEADQAKETMKTEVERAQKSVQAAVTDFIEATLPDHRQKVIRFVELESKVPFTEACRTLPSATEIVRVYKDIFGRGLVAGDVQQLEKFVAETHTCTPERLKWILTNPVQGQVDQLYKEVYGREPDLYARAYWGIRLARIYTIADARTYASMSEEVVLKKKASRAAEK